MTNPH